MAIDPINAVSGVTGAEKSLVNKPGQNKFAKDTVQDTEAAVFERSAPVSEKNLTYTRDTVKLNEIKSQVEQKYTSLKTLVEKLFSSQYIRFGQSEGLGFDEIMQKYDGNLKEFYSNLQVDDATRLSAQQDIAEDGYWGVKQTAQRLVDFAIALSGGDKSKLSELKAAIEKGFAAAEKSWGGALPDISYRTREAALAGLDDWANGSR